MENEENKVNEEVEQKTQEQVQEVLTNDEDKIDISEYEELNDRYKRMLAEFENYKKRSQKERENIYGMITGDVVATMLPIMDNLEKEQFKTLKRKRVSVHDGYLPTMFFKN